MDFKKRTAKKILSREELLASLSLAFGVAGQAFLYFNINIPAGLFFFIFAVICLVRAEKHIVKNEKDMIDPFHVDLTAGKKTEFVIFSLIIITAAFMRLFRIDTVPAGCYYDEALNGLHAINILHGNSLPVYIGPQAPNNAAVYMYYIAVIFKFFGIGAAQIRITSAILGILAIPAFYFLIRYMAGPVPALTGAFILAVMRWHIIFSRIGFHAVFAVIAVILVLYFAVRAYNEEKTTDFILLGATLAFSLYTYQSARLIPFVVLFFAVYVFIRDKDFFPRNRRKIMISAVIAFIIFIPLGIYIMNNFDAFMFRQNEVSIFGNNPDPSLRPGEQGRIQVLMNNIRENLLMFNYKGDPNSRHNLPGRPELDFMTGLFAVIGFGYALARFSHPVYFLFLSGFFVFMSAGFLSIESPQSLRTILAVPCVVFFSLVFIMKFISSFHRKKGFRVPGLIIGLLLLVLFAENYNTYFNLQAHDKRCWYDFSTREFTAGQAAETALNESWGVSAASYYMHHPSFMFGADEYAKCGTFDLSSSIPGDAKENKNRLYLLPLEYTPVGDFLKELYPNAYTLDYPDKISGEPLFRAYVIPAYDLQNLNYDAAGHGARVTYYEEHGFKGRSITQKVPVIVLTRSENPGFEPASAIWSAGLEIPATGDYIFELHSISSSLFYIDEKMAAENPGKNSSCEWETNAVHVYLTRGAHTIEIKYDSNNFRNLGCAGLWLLWQKPGDTAASVISGRLLTPGKGGF